MSYRIDPGAPLDAETRRILAEQLDKATAELSMPGRGADSDLHEAIHDARKRLKKLRGLLRLVRPGHERFYRTWNERLRDVARTLSAVRDRTALIESLDALEAHVPQSLAASAVEDAFAGVRAGLEARRRAVIETAGDLSTTLDAALANLGEARAALDGLAFAKPVRQAAEIASTGYALTHAAAREALKQADAGGTAEDRHALRRHVKYLGFHLTLLAPLWPEAFAPLRTAAATIADDLGRDHDYALLTDELSVEGEGALASPAHSALVAALIAARQAELQGVALGAARRLLAEKPKAAKTRIRRLYRKAATASTASTASLAANAPPELAAAAE